MITIDFSITSSIVPNEKTACNAQYQLRLDLSALYSIGNTKYNPKYNKKINRFRQVLYEIQCQYVKNL